jgi:serine/threonine protein phosphatase PrpC
MGVEGKGGAVEEVSVFAVYDGHGGQGCAEYLREYMPLFI